MTDDFILDGVISAMIERPRTFSELFAHVHTHDAIDGAPVHLDDIDEALDIIYFAGALQYFKETRHGERMRIFALKTEARSYRKCRECKGTGFQQDAKRGLCHFCKGNGIYTPDPLKHEVYR